MSKLEYKSDAIFKDPFYKEKKCNKKAMYKIKLEDETDYTQTRCGIHSRKMDRIEIYAKNNKKEIPQEILDLFNEIDKLNNNL